MAGRTPKKRCPWAKANNPRYLAYHDLEWGIRRVLSDDDLFELLSLECFQAGLSWETILNKRDGFRAAFRGFRIESVARMGKTDVERLLKDPGIVRNRAKILATVGNAKALRTLIRGGRSFHACLEDFRPRSRRRPWRSMADVPAFTDEAVALSKDLKRRGFSFVGPTVVYSFMQASGMVNDHLASCFLAPR